MKKRLIGILLIAAMSMAMILLPACQSEIPLTAADYLSLGEKFLLELDYEQAVVQFLKVIEIEPMNPHGYTGAAEAYIALGEIDEAIDVLREGLEALPDNEEIQELADELEAAEEDEDNADGEAAGDSPTGYDVLSDEDKAFLNEIAAAMLEFLESYKDGAFDDDAAAGLNTAESIYALQNSERYRLLVDSVYINDGGEAISFSPADDVLVKLFRMNDDGAATYHFDLYSGENGSGYYLGSRGGWGITYSTLHVAPYSGGKANGTARYFVFPAEQEREPVVERLELQDGAAYGTGYFTTKSGETYTDDSNIASQNWFPDWQEG